ncbi:MAG: thioredoxin domain-containing protein, partial [Thermoflexales bacterium]
MSGSTLVEWREWSEATFAEAKAKNKPVLLGISAVWCHWCHVMDHGIPGDPIHTGVYSDPQIANYINEHFIPIRVDNDQRPDINARYNMGGWPTTCFLTPDGDVLYGATYLAPSHMRAILPRIVSAWHTGREEILRQIAEAAGQAEARKRTPAPADAPLQQLANVAEDVWRAVITRIVRNYDRRHGGLGEGQKFPMSDVWALLIAEHLRSKEPLMLDLALRTLVAMGTGGMYDRVAGGWFRYSTTPDWSVPHFEKMLEDHARLLPVYAQAIACCRKLGRQEEVRTLSSVVESALDYLLSTLLRDTPSLVYFAGSQDADEHYYMLSRLERAKLTPPFIDWRLYADWNALMVSALLHVAAMLERPALAALAERIWDTLVRYTLQSDGSVIHSLIPDGDCMRPSSLVGVLADQAALLQACLDVAQCRPSRAAQAMRVASQVWGYVCSALQAEDGGFYDVPPRQDALGMLRVRIKPLADNAALAAALAQWSSLTDDVSLREAAAAALCAFLNEYPRYGEHAAPFALAVWRA